MTEILPTGEGKETPLLGPKRELTNLSLKAERQTSDLASSHHDGHLGLLQPAASQEPGKTMLALERDVTDAHLTGERAGYDDVLVDQREANEQMVRATLRAQELTDEAEAGKALAEQSERELRNLTLQLRESERQVTESLKRERELAELRETFMGILGHDLRNPISAIALNANHVLRRGQLQADDAESISRILRSGKRIMLMITQLLDLTRGRLGGGMPIELATVHLDDVCRDVVAEFATPVRLAVRGDVQGTWDPERLAQVISNLVANAMEYSTPDGEVVVAVYGEDDGVVLDVSNPGEPIPADLLPHIFEPFRRGRQHQKSPTGNLGLGLYIAQQIVLAHGGTLRPESHSGSTTFRVRLPRHSRVPTGEKPER